MSARDERIRPLEDCDDLSDNRFLITSSIDSNHISISSNSKIYAKPNHKKILCFQYINRDRGRLWIQIIGYYPNL
jgi:hypothetical protein